VRKSIAIKFGETKLLKRKRRYGRVSGRIIMTKYENKGNISTASILGGDL